MTTETSNAIRSRIALGRLAALITAAVMIGLGTYSIITSRYYGYTAKLGGAEVSLAGGNAQIMGWLYVLLGLMPMALWFRTARAGVLWACACAGGFLVLLASWLYG